MKNGNEKGCGPHLVLVTDTNEYNVVSIQEEAEIVRGKPISCPMLKVAKTITSNITNAKFKYLFHISKGD